eukprot:2390060-Pleurochrysis_carterae.AAC.1
MDAFRGQMSSEKCNTTRCVRTLATGRKERCTVHAPCGAQRTWCVHSAASPPPSRIPDSIKYLHSVLVVQNK